MVAGPLALAFAAVLHFNTPCFNASDSIACGTDSLAPLVDLAHVTLYGQARGSELRATLAVKPVRPCEPESLEFDPGPGTWSVWVTFADSAGNESCPSNVVGVNLTTGVAPGSGGGGLELRAPRLVSWGAIVTVETSRRGHLVLELLDATGRRRATLLEGEHGPGTVRALWLAALVPQGVYFVRARLEGATAVRRLAVVR